MGLRVNSGEGRHAHLVSQSGQVSLEALVFALESLHAGQVVAVIVGVQGLILLLDPLLGLVGIPAGTQGGRRCGLAC